MSATGLIVDFAADAPRGNAVKRPPNFVSKSETQLLENLRYSQSQIGFGIKRIFEKTQEPIKMFLRNSQNWFARIGRELEFSAQNIIAGIKNAGRHNASSGNNFVKKRKHFTPRVFVDSKYREQTNALPKYS